MPTKPTEADVETEAKRWFREVSGWEWAGNSPPIVASLCRAHARYTLERTARPEDVEAVARVISKVYFNTESAWESVRFVDVALAIIAAYGPLPSPPQITDADVERCVAEHGIGFMKCSGTIMDSHAAGIRAALTAFLNPPPPDPNQAAPTPDAPTLPWWSGTVMLTGRYRLKRDPWHKLYLQHLVTDTAAQRKRWVVVETVESGASDDA